MNLKWLVPHSSPLCKKITLNCNDSLLVYGKKLHRKYDWIHRVSQIQTAHCCQPRFCKKILHGDNQSLKVCKNEYTLLVRRRILFLLIQHWSQPNNEEIRQYLSIKSNQLQSLLSAFERPEGGSLQWGLKQFGGSN